MTLKQYTLALFLGFSFLTSAQTNQNIDSSYVNYFNLTREIPYLHLNKTTFSKGQEIWFQAYVLNLNTQKLHNKTTNLYISIYCENGSLKKKKLLFVENGIAAGNFLIDSTFTDRNYYIKASTSWMKNFHEDEAYIQKIKIIENKQETKKSSESKLDIQLLPESGHLLTNAVNTIGITVKDPNNKGIKIKEGIIFNLKSEIITKFKTNVFGFGKATFRYKENENYKAVFVFANGQKITKKIQPAKKKGVIISLFNPNTSFIKVTAKTNSTSLSSLIDKKYSLYIHNTKTLIKQNFTFNKETTNYTVTLNTKKLPAGINIVTLFNHKNQPVSERLFFNYKKPLIIQPKVSFKSVHSDSLSITIHKNQNDSIKYFLSGSFLPQYSQSYQPTNTIFTKFLLKPYIKGDIENSKYYFEKPNRKKLNDLDLVLLTQGWSKYKWSNIFNSPPTNKHSFESGITLEGTINTKNTKRLKQVFVMSKENNLFLSANVHNSKFKLNNLYLKDNSSLNFSVIKGKRGKKIDTDIRFSPTKTFEEFKLKKRHESSSNFISLKKLTKDRVLLDEVTIKGKTKKKGLAGISGPLKRYKITEKSQKTERLFDFIRSRGFFLTQENGRINIFNRRGLYSEPKEPRVVLDGRVIVDEGVNDLDDIEFLTISDIDEITTSSLGNGEIHIYSKKTIKTRRKNTAFLSTIVPFGYSVEKEYYQPKNLYNNKEDFDKYGSIYWKSNITIDSTKKDIQFTISSLNKKNISVYFEGITSEGSLILIKKTININK